MSESIGSGMNTTSGQRKTSSVASARKVPQPVGKHKDKKFHKMVSKLQGRSGY